MYIYVYIYMYIYIYVYIYVYIYMYIKEPHYVYSSTNPELTLACNYPDHGFPGEFPPIWGGSLHGVPITLGPYLGPLIFGNSHLTLISGLKSKGACVQSS